MTSIRVWPTFCRGFKEPVPQPGPARRRLAARRVIIFTEYADTKRYLQQVLGDAIRESLRGSRAHRYLPRRHWVKTAAKAIKSAWNADPQRHPIRILIATDAPRAKA